MYFSISRESQMKLTSGFFQHRIQAQRRLKTTILGQTWRYDANYSGNQARHLFSKSKVKSKSRSKISSVWQSKLKRATTLAFCGGLFYILYKTDNSQPLSPSQLRRDVRTDGQKWEAVGNRTQEVVSENPKMLSGLPLQRNAQTYVAGMDAEADDSAWGKFSSRFATFTLLKDIQWNSVTEKVTDFVMPEWAKILPGYINKLQRELSMAPGSLADEIWQEAHNPFINPEIEYSASVRVSMELCDEEKEFLQRRRKVTTRALAKYLGLQEDEVHPDDVPCIAMVGSGGGLRALVAGTGSMLASGEDGLFGCATYTAGVSGSCWLQAIYHSSVSGRQLDKMVDHLKARIGVHIAYPPVALAALNSAPTNKFLLSGFVEKLKGDPAADFGLVDVYGLLLAARLIVPKGEIGVDDRDLKISNQRDFIKNGEHPMPIYTAVRHEIPIIEEATSPSESTKEKAKEKVKKEAWFQWFEITPYELFCEEISAGIPTWAVGRKFRDGKDLPKDASGLRVPELRLPLLLGVFGSAFCATLSHYYKEVRPLVKGLVGFKGIDGMIEGRNEDLSKVHPIVPASIPNFAYGMEGKLPETTPESIYKNSHLQLMDAGMSNNLPIYPLLRPGRDIDILIAFDASADIKTENWLSVTEGYARQRGIKGWPIGIGWPKPSDTAEKAAGQLEEAQASTSTEADIKVEAAKARQKGHLKDVKDTKDTLGKAATCNTESEEDSGDLGYCTIWVGTTQERSTPADEHRTQPSKAVKEDWQLMEPDAGITVVYFPFLSNPKVEGVDPVTSEYMSTWNFVYTPEDIDNIVALARANFEEGKERTRRCVRAVYERKKKQREKREAAEREEQWRRKMRLGTVGHIGEGDHFS